ncbi:MAG: hypothetical protein ACI9OE_000055 [Mariniflexile sp.]|jgi:hypothetical protein
MRFFWYLHVLHDLTNTNNFFFRMERNLDSFQKYLGFY